LKQAIQPVYNFNAGPSALPTAVLEKAQQELLNFRGTGMSVMELSHRSAAYEEVHNNAITRLKTLFSIPENYEVLFFTRWGKSSIFDDSNELFTTRPKSCLCEYGSMVRKSICRGKAIWRSL